MCRLSHTYLTFVLIIVLTPLWARPEYATLPRPLAVSRGTGFEDLPGRWPSPGGRGQLQASRGSSAPPPPRRGRWWRHLSRLREGSQVSADPSRE